jgi:hypothetical protein
MKTSLVVLLAVVGLIAGVSPASAQVRWGRGAVPRAGACFYEDSNFGGRYFCATAGQSLASLPSGMGDRISSIRTFGDVEVIVFRDRSFRGRSSRFAGAVDNLKRLGWSDTISSLRVERGRFDGRPGRGEGPVFGGRGPVWGRGPQPREGACFFEDSNFRGRYFCLERGGSYASLPPGFNDKISSIRVFRGSVTIYVDDNFRGRSTRFSRDVPNLGSFWGDRISSIRFGR